MEVTAELRTEERGVRTVALDDGATAADLVEALGYHPEAHLVVRGESPLPLDTELDDGDEVTVLRIVSGGDGHLPRRREPGLRDDRSDGA